MKWLNKLRLGLKNYYINDLIKKHLSPVNADLSLGCHEVDPHRGHLPLHEGVLNEPGQEAALANSGIAQEDDFAA